MLLPPVLLILVMYIFFAGLLWFVAHILAPVGYQVSLWRCMATAVLITVADKGLPPLLRPLIGDWSFLVVFVAYFVIIKSCLSLPFWRSAFIVLVYAITTVGVHYFLFGRGHATA